ncbi:MAG: NAD kinase [Bacteroidota bacterium]|nr:NAD kinase [Bacteroidota bacterium]
MKIGLYAKVINTSSQKQLVENIIEFLKTEGVEVFLHQNISDLFNGKFKCKEFETILKSNLDIDFLVTVGGDGTILDTIEITGNSKTPVIGINTGRLGFLANVNTDAFKIAFKDLANGNFTLDKRALLQLESNVDLFGFNYALNDFVLHKKESSSMITVHAFLNGEPLNSYWADGLIIATPTGSSGYSLSCGGPIIFPKASNFVITPIAPHNLNVRPVVIPDDQVLSFEIEGRSNSFLASLDSRSVTINNHVQIAIKKADFYINLVRFEGDSFLKTLRNKMLWGLDNRN